MHRYRYFVFISYSRGFDPLEDSFRGTLLRDCWDLKSLTPLEAVRKASASLVREDQYSTLYKFRANDFPHKEYGINLSKISVDDTIWVEVWDMG